MNGNTLIGGVETACCKEVYSRLDPRIELAGKCGRLVYLCIEKCGTQLLSLGGFGEAEKAAVLEFEERKKRVLSHD